MGGQSIQATELQAGRDIIINISNDRKQLILKDVYHRCCICHSPSNVDLHPLDVRNGSKKDLYEYSDLIPLCFNCYQKVKQQGIPADKLRAIKETWARLCYSGEPPAYLHNKLQDELENIIKEATHLALIGKNLWEIKQARLLCQEALYRYDPFNLQAQMLLEKLIPIEMKMERIAAQEDRRVYLNQYNEVSKRFPWTVLLVAALSVYLIISKMLDGRIMPTDIGKYWELIKIGLVSMLILLLSRRKDFIVLLASIILLPIMFVHETGHILALSIIVKNAQGKRIPLLYCYKYLEVNNLPFNEGVKDAVRKARLFGEIPAIAVNQSRMIREWYTKVHF